MNICMLCPSHHSWDPRVVMRESRSLIKAGHRVAIVAKADESREFIEGAELLEAPKVNWYSRWERIRAMWRVYRIARSWPADVYHAHEVESLAVGLLLKWRTGTKLVWDSHECFQFTAARFLSGWKAKLVTAFTARMLKWVSKWVDHVIVVSFTNEQFYLQFCHHNKVTIIYNSPIMDVFHCDKKTAEAEKIVTHSGNLSPDRGMMQILDALAIVKEKMPVKFIQVGSIIDCNGYPEQFEKQVKELGLDDVVEVTGWVPYKQMAEILNKSLIGLLAIQPSPNSYTTLHNKTFSSMCTGQALIVPKGSDTEKIIRETNCGLAIDMTDPQKLANAIMSLMEDSKQCRQLGQNGRKGIEEKFGWHIMENLLWKIYEDLEK